MKLRLPSQLYSLLISASVSLTLTAGVSSAKDGFSINFSKGDNGKLSGADLAGVIPTKADNWTNISAPSGTPTNLKSNEGTLLTGLSVLSTSANHHFGSGATGGNGTLLTGFIDDGGSNIPYTVTIAGSPYLVSTVYLIMAGDGTDYQGYEGSKFTAMSVNGVSYTGNGATTSVGTGVWGDRNPGQSLLSEEKNYLQVDNITGSQIVIQNIVNAGGRGTIAGIQVVDAYKGTKHDLTLTANGTWKGVSSVAWAPAWVDSTATNGTYASITSKVAGGAILTIGTSDSVTTDAVVLTGDSTSDLTISGGTLNLINLGILKVDSADRTLTINSTLSGKAVIDGLGTLALGATTLTVGDAQDRAFSGTLKGTADSHLVKTGTGKQSIAKLDLTTYLGTINVQEGTLEIGTKFNTFTTTKVTTSNNGTFALNMTNDGNDGATATSIINLGDKFSGNLAINSGVFAINNKDEAKGANIGTGKLHLKNGTTFLIRYGITGGTDVFSNDILLGSGTINLRAYGSVHATISSNIKGENLVSGAWNMLRKHDGGTISLTGTIDYKGIFKSEAGITNFHSTVNLGNLFIGNATVNLQSGTNMTVNQLRFTEGDGGSVFNVNAGSTLNVTGKNNGHGTDNSFMLSHYGGTSYFNVTGGIVNAQNTRMLTAWDGTSVTQVSGGVLNVLEICYWGNGNDRGDVFLGTNTDGTASNENATGRINIGSAGISVLREADTRLILGRGTIGALADWATDTKNGGQRITVLSKLGTIFDTSNVTDPKSGHTITLNHSLTGTGKIIKTGEGTLVLNATDKTTLSDFSGGTEINGGTLKANHAQALGTGDVTINGGTLDATNKYLGNKMTIKGGKISNFAKSGNTLKEIRLLATNKDTNKTITIDNSFLQATTKGSVNIGLGNQLIMMGGSTVTLGNTGQSDVATIALGNINLTNGTNQAAMTVTLVDTLTLAGTWTLDLSGFTGATEKTDYVFHIVSLTGTGTYDDWAKDASKKLDLNNFQGFNITGNTGFTVKNNVKDSLKKDGTVTLTYKGGSTPAVPEPSTVSLTLLALTGLLLRRRRAN